MSEPGCTTIREVLARVGDKWSVFVITLLGERTLRFTELQRSIDGISQRMLTLTLRQLERDGLVDRVVYPIVPPRVEYSLTALGRTLLAPLLGLAGWADAHRGDIEAARVEYDAQAEASPTPCLMPAAIAGGRCASCAGSNTAPAVELPAAWKAFKALAGRYLAIEDAMPWARMVPRMARPMAAPIDRDNCVADVATAMSSRLTEF